MIKPILYLLISSSLASAAELVPTDDSLSQTGPSEKEAMVNKYLNEYLEIANSDKRAALKKTNRNAHRL